MLNRFGSLRLRITLLATLAVSVALVAAGLGLVMAVERTLIGRAQDAAVDQLDRVADALAGGEDLHQAVTAPIDIFVEVRDENGDVVQMIPDLTSAATPMFPDTVVSSDVEPTDEVARRGAIIIRTLDSEEMILAQRKVSTEEGERTVVAISPLGEVSNSIDTIVRTLWWGTPFLVAFVGGVCWYLTGRTLRPVAAMTTRAEEISDTNLHERLPSSETDDEVKRLADTLNSMLARLESASHRQREFVSDASHELRSPIAAIRAQLEVALAHPDASTWEHTAKTVLAETARLERLVGDLLALARAEERTLSSAAVDLSAQVRDEVERRGDPKVVLTSAAAGEVAGDPDLLERVISNLLDNASRYARSRVEIAVEEVDGAVRLSVADDGPGVPTADRARIFSRFVRLDEGRSRDDGGLGIGLALVKRIAEAHAGTATCTTSSMGGALFEVTLPVRQ